MFSKRKIKREKFVFWSSAWSKVWKGYFPCNMKLSSNVFKLKWLFGKLNHERLPILELILDLLWCPSSFFFYFFRVAVKKEIDFSWTGKISEICLCFLGKSWQVDQYDALPMPQDLFRKSLSPKGQRRSRQTPILAVYSTGKNWARESAEIARNFCRLKPTSKPENLQSQPSIWAKSKRLDDLFALRAAKTSLEAEYGTEVELERLFSLWELNTAFGGCAIALYATWQKRSNSRKNASKTWPLLVGLGKWITF